MSIIGKQFAFERKGKIITALLLVFSGLLPGGPFSLFPKVVVLPLLIYGAAILLGIKLKKIEVAEFGIILWIFSGFVILKSVGIRPTIADENIYFYMAENLVHGKLPYKDFFFAHPPGHLIFIAPFFLFGFDLVTAKLIPVIFTMTGALFVYLAFRRVGNKTAGIIFLFFYLYAYQVLMGSSNLNGENIIVFFLALSVYLAVRGNYILSGVAAALAVSSGLYALAGVMAIGLMIGFLNNEKDHKITLAPHVRYFSGFTLSFLLVFGVSYLVAGDDFLNGVFRYHALKAPKGGRISIFSQSNIWQILSNYQHNFNVFWKEKVLLRSFYFHSPVYLAAFGYILTVVSKLIIKKQRKAGKRIFNRDDVLAFLGITATFLFVLQFAALNEIYDYYFVPMLLFTVLPASVFVAKVFTAVIRFPTYGWLAIPAMLLLFWLSLPLSAAAMHALWPKETEHAGEKVFYDWNEPVAFNSLAGLCKKSFFSNYRVRGKVTPFYQHYIWNKSLGLSMGLDEVVLYIRQNLKKGSTISGAANVAPLVALLSDVRMANNEADLNHKRFKTGLLSDETFLRKAKDDHLQYIISTPRSHFSALRMEKHPLYKSQFKKVAGFVDSNVLHHSAKYVIEIYELK